MRRISPLLVVSILLAALAGLQPSRARSQQGGPSQDDTRRSLGNLRPDDPTAFPAIQGSPPAVPSRPYLPPGYVAPVPVVPYPVPVQPYLPDYGYDPAWHGPGPYGWPYPYQPYWYREYGYYGPLFVPAETLYGPQAMRRFLGADQPNPPLGGGPAAPGEAGAVQPEKPPVQARTNQRSINLGWRFIGFGDAYFAGQKYYDAYSRYKDAAQAAPTLADAYFRQGIALFAAGRYELAAKALRRGLALDPNWPASDFRLDELYGQNQMAKAAHIDALAKAADAQPHNADLLFLLGVALYFNGQADQAATFFQKSNQMAVGDNGHLRPFLDRVKPAEQK